MAISNHARLFGVLGDPVEHSLSPAMHNAAFAATGLPHLYLRYRVAPADLGAALAEARALRLGGLNLTVPLKEAAVALVDALTPEAERVGAVNTLVFAPGGRVTGDNTDARGFTAALAGRVRWPGARVVLVGAGGSARAVGSALARSGAAEVIVANRTPARAEALAERLAAERGVRVTVVPLAALATGEALAGASLVVNATPLGLTGGRLRIRYAATPRRCLFMDLVYATRPTPFCAGAAHARRPAMDGAAMLLHQGALAFETWTGRRAPRAAMAAALRAAGLGLTGFGGAGTVRGRRPPTP